MSEGATSPSASADRALNQSPPFGDVNLYESDKALSEAVEREGAGHAASILSAFGAQAGSSDSLELGRLANETPPKFRPFDSRGNRLDRVDFVPAYHACMKLSIGQGLHCSSWDHLRDGSAGETPLPGANVTRVAGLYLAAQMEAGHCCPITMTNASVATLRHHDDIAKAWLPKILNRNYSPDFKPWTEKPSVTIGMGMTEKQGGTDVRTNTTAATPVRGGASAGAYLLNGHKWFMSAPMSDAFLVLAQAPGGLSCFLMPRFRSDGSLNAIRIQRLKEKLGNRSNASSEVEFHDAAAWLIGEEGRGIATILEMVTYTRLDCAASSAGLMRFCLASAIHHCRHRKVFGQKLIEQPIMTRVLADMALDVEAATALVFRLARAFDNPQSEADTAWQRVMTPVTKYWVCKIAPALAYEAMECLGGNGYVEEDPIARIYRELPVNAIWEGAGNVMCLDVLRVLTREPDAMAAVLDELAELTNGQDRLEAALVRLQDMLHRPIELDSNARALVESLATLAGGALLHAHAPSYVADPFASTRLAGHWRHTYGAGYNGDYAGAILDRAYVG